MKPEELLHSLNSQFFFLAFYTIAEIFYPRQNKMVLIILLDLNNYMPDNNIIIKLLIVSESISQNEILQKFCLSSYVVRNDLREISEESVCRCWKVHGEIVVVASYLNVMHDTWFHCFMCATQYVQRIRATTRIRWNAGSVMSSGKLIINVVTNARSSTEISSCNFVSPATFVDVRKF